MFLQEPWLIIIYTEAESGFHKNQNQTHSLDLD